MRLLPSPLMWSMLLYRPSAASSACIARPYLLLRMSCMCFQAHPLLSLHKPFASTVSCPPSILAVNPILAWQTRPATDLLLGDCPRCTARPCGPYDGWLCYQTTPSGCVLHTVVDVPWCSQPHQTCVSVSLTPHGLTFLWSLRPCDC